MKKKFFKIKIQFQFVLKLKTFFTKCLDKDRANGTHSSRNRK
ncbi:hypothetical protein LEP1GSC082_4424 [Leptospira kirschneri str. H2]|nr:hypothetical protein LEP1GSC082_4424 [Leptospira kirschneri str. H2]